MVKKIIVVAMFAASIGSIVAPAGAATYSRVAPPPPRQEVAPQARPGRVWVAGHWGWQNNQHKWVAGTWINERRGYHYVQPNWTERDGRWYMERGNWRRGDRDGDGVPNGRDRAPNNPNRS